MFYTQSVFISWILEKNFDTHPLEDFYIVHDHIDASFLSLIQKYFHVAHQHIGAFCLFLLEKVFGTFRGPFLKTFLYFFFNIFTYRKKYIKKYRVSFFLYALKFKFTI